MTKSNKKRVILLVFLILLLATIATFATLLATGIFFNDNDKNIENPIDNPYTSPDMPDDTSDNNTSCDCFDYCNENYCYCELYGDCSGGNNNGYCSSYSTNDNNYNDTDYCCSDSNHNSYTPSYSDSYYNCYDSSCVYCSSGNYDYGSDSNGATDTTSPSDCTSGYCSSSNDTSDTTCTYNPACSSSPYYPTYCPSDTASDSPPSDSTSTYPIYPRAPVHIVAAGANHSVALDYFGNIFTWGNNTRGQLGRATMPLAYSSTPTKLNVFNANDTRVIFSFISAGSNHTIAIDSFGRIFGWGCNAYGQLGIGANIAFIAKPTLILLQNSHTLPHITSVFANFNHTFAIDYNYRLWGFGDNSNRIIDYRIPVAQTRIFYPTPLLPHSQIQSIATGNTFSIALAKNGYLFTWGAGANVGLQNIYTTTTNLFYRIIAVSENASIVMCLDKNIWAWGCGVTLGLSVATIAFPTISLHLNNFVSISINSASNSMLKINSIGALYYNFNLIGSSIGINFIAISAGNNHYIALDNLGRVWAWGNNNYGQIKNCVSIAFYTATLLNLNLFTGSYQYQYTNCECKFYYSPSYSPSDSSYCPSYYPSDYPSDYPPYTPSDCPPCTSPPDTTPPDIIEFIKIVHGKNHTLALDAHGRVWGFGDNSYGQLGLGSGIAFVEKYYPVLLFNHTGNATNFRVVYISVFKNSSFVIDCSGILWGFGCNAFGRIDYKNFALRLYLPVALHTDLLFKSVKTTETRTLALTMCGELWTWGTNFGSMGISQSFGNIVFVNINIAYPIYKIYILCLEHTIVIDKSGQKWGWGFIGYVLGTLDFSILPVRIKS